MEERDFTLKDGHLVFANGESLLFPPPTDDARRIMQDKLAECWKPSCKNCGSVKTPVVRQEGRITAQCSECNHRRMLEREYSLLSDTDLHTLVGDIMESTNRRLAVINTVLARRIGGTHAKV